MEIIPLAWRSTTVTSGNSTKCFKYLRLGHGLRKKIISRGQSRLPVPVIFYVITSLAASLYRRRLDSIARPVSFRATRKHALYRLIYLASTRVTHTPLPATSIQPRPLWTTPFFTAIQRRVYVRVCALFILLETRSLRHLRDFRL